MPCSLQQAPRDRSPYDQTRKSTYLEPWSLPLYFRQVTGPVEVQLLDSLHPMKYRAEQDFTGQEAQVCPCCLDYLSGGGVAHGVRKCYMGCCSTLKCHPTVSFIQETFTGMKYCSLWVRLGSVGKEQQKVSCTGQCAFVLVESSGRLSNF